MCFVEAYTALWIEMRPWLILSSKADRRGLYSLVDWNTIYIYGSSFSIVEAYTAWWIEMISVSMHVHSGTVEAYTALWIEINMILYHI